MHFLYFFPNVKAVNNVNRDDVLGTCGLSNVLDGLHAISRETPNGPSGEAGCVCAFERENSGIEYRVYLSKEQQTWRKCEGGKFWLGYWNDAKPTPGNLERNEKILSYNVKMGDGNMWLLPIALAYDGGDNLPKQAGWGEDGTVIREILPRYLEFSHKVHILADSYYESGTWGISENEQLEYAVQSISLNYHVGKYELTALGVFSPESMTVLCTLLALIDQPSSAEKKRALSEGSNMNDGQAD